ncbi:MAG: nucleotidyltransferase domain-containing protein [Spirochaetaceae bacterium]|nr:nucleotidyltransferase domain-containing protein [Spirochaetaceae bacterium]
MTRDRSGPGGFDLSRYRAAAERREGRRKAAKAERREKALAFLPRIREAFLEIDPEVKAILLFGSLARGEPEREGFDIDIAVRSERYLGLVSWALRQEWKIDVVDLDTIAGTPLVGLEKESEVLYERQ